MKAIKLLEKPLVDLQTFADKTKQPELAYLVRELEAIAVRAGEIAAYLNERSGYGCGDQGHAKAVKELNKTGRAIWVKAFGYNEYRNVSF